MSYRAWLFIVALGLILVSGPGQAQEPTEGPQGQPSQQQEPSQPFPLPFPVVVVEDEATAIARQGAQEESRQWEREYLVAQQGMNAATQAMNDATQRMANYAFWSNVLVAIGTALLFVTLFLTWQANGAAREAVEATRDVGRAAVEATRDVGRASVEVTRAVGIAQIRAYITLNALNAPETSGFPRAAGCRIGIANKGVGPATIATIDAQGFVAQYPLPEDHEVPDNWTTLGRNVILHSGIPSDFTAQATMEDSDVSEVIASGAKRLYYAARVIYSDSVGQGHVEQLCVSVDFSKGHPRFENANKHNESR